MNCRFFVLIFFLMGIGNIAFSQNSINYEDVKAGFMADTARVEAEISAQLDKDFTTIGMIEASAEYEKKYDVLLNKYYKILYQSLTIEGKKALKTSQLTWIKFRDSEKDLISKINSQAYEEAGGGTIWGIIASNSRAEITKKRVVELYNYLMYGYLGG